jgi:hypothetical protein
MEELSLLFKGAGFLVLIWKMVGAFQEGWESAGKEKKSVSKDFSFFSENNNVGNSLTDFYCKVLNLDQSLPLQQNIVKQRARDMMVELMGYYPQDSQQQNLILAAKKYLCELIEKMESLN